MSAKSFIIVAIDGGAASGKSSTARALSERFHLMHVDTGAHYRTLTHELLRRSVSPGDSAAVHAALAALRLGTEVDGRTARMQVNGETPGEEIRSPAVNEAVSHFAALPEVRQFLLSYQRQQAGEAKERGFRGLVMEGRDIGSVIFPDADLRFFLSADPVERARRRADQGQQDKILERDRLDTERKAAPLVRPQGAVSVDTTHLPLDQVVRNLGALIDELLN